MDNNSWYVEKLSDANEWQGDDNNDSNNNDDNNFIVSNTAKPPPSPPVLSTSTTNTSSAATTLKSSFKKSIINNNTISPLPHERISTNDVSHSAAQGDNLTDSAIVIQPTHNQTDNDGTNNNYSSSDKTYQ